MIMLQNGFVLLSFTTFGLLVDQFWVKWITSESVWQKPLLLTMFRNLFSCIFLIKLLVKTPNLSRLPKLEFRSLLYGMITGPILLTELLMVTCGLKFLTIPTLELIYGTSVVFVYFFTTAIGRDRFIKATIIPTFITITCSVALYWLKPSDHVNGEVADQPIGFTFAFLSMLLDVALVLIVNLASDPMLIGESLIIDDAFFAGQAIGSLTVTGPIVLFAVKYNIEVPELPPRAIAVQIFFMGLIMAPLIQFCHMKSCMLLSPLLVQMVLTIIGPASAFIDHFVMGKHDYPMLYVLIMGIMVSSCLISSSIIEKHRSILMEENQKKFNSPLLNILLLPAITEASTFADELDDENYYQYEDSTC